ncbi:hypothetical protein ACHBTE_12070 [Streptomyces sp. M41]|uniref:hypothetical protein n=1 Tax=Streptomyces sp. M41 TaxID=3059412 RepID=UPI00374D0C91
MEPLSATAADGPVGMTQDDEPGLTGTHRRTRAGGTASGGEQAVRCAFVSAYAAGARTRRLGRTPPPRAGRVPPRTPHRPGHPDRPASVAPQQE